MGQKIILFLFLLQYFKAWQNFKVNPDRFRITKPYCSYASDVNNNKYVGPLNFLRCVKMNHMRKSEKSAFTINRYFDRSLFRSFCRWFSSVFSRQAMVTPIRYISCSSLDSSAMFSRWRETLSGSNPKKVIARFFHI
jgi:hypothetical protein